MSEVWTVGGGTISEVWTVGGGAISDLVVG